MITVSMGPGGSPFLFHVSARGLTLYLDSFAVIELAKNNASRRQRLITLFESGSLDLLFSVTNAAELSALQGRSLRLVKAFLNEIGPHWIPAELNPFLVVEREMTGAKLPFLCEQIMKDYFTQRAQSYEPKSGAVIDLSFEFFRLGLLLDWVCEQRDSIRETTAEMDAKLIEVVRDEQILFKQDPAAINRKYPVVPFNPSMPATFAFLSLRRRLITYKQQQLKKGDGLDYAHAVMASAFASVAALDRHWKRRIESLPKPNKLARIYYQPGLDQMVTDIERYVGQAQTAA